MWSTSPGTHQRRIYHSNDIFYLLLYLLKRVQATYHCSHIEFFYDVLLWWQADTGYKSLGSLPFHPPTESIYNVSLYYLKKYPKLDQSDDLVQNHIHSAMSWLFPTQATKPPAVSHKKETQFHRSYGNPHQQLSRQNIELLKSRKITIPFKNVNAISAVFHRKLRTWPLKAIKILYSRVAVFFEQGCSTLCRDLNSTSGILLTQIFPVKIRHSFL